MPLQIVGSIQSLKCCKNNLYALGMGDRGLLMAFPLVSLLLLEVEYDNHPLTNSVLKESF